MLHLWNEKSSFYRLITPEDLEYKDIHEDTRILYIKFMNMNDYTMRMRGLLIYQAGVSSWRAMSHLDLTLQPNY